MSELIRRYAERIDALGLRERVLIFFGLALALARAGYSVRLHGRKRKNVPEPLTLTVGDGEQPPPWIAEVDVVILAVRDDAITPLATSLAKARVITERHVVLHLSGVQGQEALGPLVSSRAGLGSLHPLHLIHKPSVTTRRSSTDSSGFFSRLNHVIRS